MKFIVASRGYNFGFPAGGGGGVSLNCSNKIIKKFPRSLILLDFCKLKLFNIFT